MSVSFKGFNTKCLTFIAASGVTKGIPVTISANKTVAAASAGSAFAGFTADVDGDIASVQMSGYVKAAYSGTAPTVGYGLLGANGTGGVKTVSTGGLNCLILNVDTTASTVEFLF